MSFTGDPANNIVDRVRLLIGDTDTFEEGLTDEVYQYVLDQNSNNEAKSAIQCLKYLVAKYANYVTEKAGGLFVKESEKYTQYSDLLKKFTRDPSAMIIQNGLPFAGGISKDDSITNATTEDNNRPTITLSSINEDENYTF